MEGKTARGHPSREAGRQRASFEVRRVWEKRGGSEGGVERGTSLVGEAGRQAGGNASAPPSCEVPPSLLGKGCSGFTPGRAAAQRAKERRAGQVDCQPRAGFFAWRKRTRGCLHPLLCRFSALPSRLWRFAMPFPSDRLSLALLLAVVTRPGLAGPVSTCDANGSLYFVGEWYSLDSDHCIQCECTAEGPACARTDCAALPPACIHVSHYPSDCCPRCERIGCEHRGQVYELGQHFQVRQANEGGVGEWDEKPTGNIKARDGWVAASLNVCGPL